MKKGLVRLRLARFGRKHAPVYNIVVTQIKKARDKLPIEVIGTYNPVPLPLTKPEIEAGQRPVKDVSLDFIRAKYWIGVGAQPSATVARLLRKAGVLPPEWPGPLTRKADERAVVQPLKKAEKDAPPPVY